MGKLAERICIFMMQCTDEDYRLAVTNAYDAGLYKLCDELLTYAGY